MELTYKLENDVNDYVKNYLVTLGMKKLVDFNEESGMSDYMKEALRGSAKTRNKTYYGKPDFHIEKYKVPVIIENKLGNKYHVSENKSGIKMDEKSISDYAVNGAIYYAKNMILSKKYDEVVAIGISGESEDNIQISVYYVFSYNVEPKLMENYKVLDFLENKKSFEYFYNEASVTEAEKHRILIKSREEILKHAKALNKMMNNHNIGVDQRVVYVSGMLLAMQDIYDDTGELIKIGMIPDVLKGTKTENSRDSIITVRQIEEYLDQKDIPEDKKKIMMDQFRMTISTDSARDIPVEIDKNVSLLLKDNASITKQVFTYIYNNVYQAIDMSYGALDIMAEMYATFLKYALSDGASLGKVLTPPYVTTLMAKILDVNKDSKVMDLATGSAAFLVASMDMMVDDALKTYGKNTYKVNEIISEIKNKQLLGIEVDAKMYTLAAANMILRGDGSSQIKKADTFQEPESLFKEFGADKLLLNPPFSYSENGMPFFLHGLNNMEVHGKGAVIIQDSSGTGKAISTNKKILSKHKLLASIMMPLDLFEPNASVPTCIYIFEAGVPHNFELDVVKFIDFRNDGYKRTSRGIKEISGPIERYQDLYLIYKLGKNAENHQDFHAELWDLDEIYCEDFITNKGNDWNFDQHYKNNKKIKSKDFACVVDGYIKWELRQLKCSVPNDKAISDYENAQKTIKKVSDLFTINTTKSFNQDELTPLTEEGEIFDYITRTRENRGIHSQTGVVPSKEINKANIYSLGLLQMKFYHRGRRWYAGQFVRKIEPLFELNRELSIYFEVLLNSLSDQLSAVLVRDVDELFLNMELEIPYKDNKMDVDLISRYINAMEKQSRENVKIYLSNKQ